jgi:hypothetical protein
MSKHHKTKHLTPGIAAGATPDLTQAVTITEATEVTEPADEPQTEHPTSKKRRSAPSRPNRSTCAGA